MGAVEFVVGNQGRKNLYVAKIQYSLSGGEVLTKEPKEDLSPLSTGSFLLDNLSPKSPGVHTLSFVVHIEWRENLRGYWEKEVFVYQGESPCRVLSSSKSHINLSQVENSRVIISAPSYGSPPEEELKPTSYRELLLRRKPLAEWRPLHDRPQANRESKILFFNGKTQEIDTHRLYQKNQLAFGRNVGNDKVDIPLHLYPLTRENVAITKTISSHHFDIILMNGGFYLVDVSTYGTSLDYSRLTPKQPVPLEEGRLISPFLRRDYIGKLGYRVKIHSSEGQISALELRLEKASCTGT